MIFGPWRIKPGGLSVSRSFGDVESKLKKFGGSENVVISDPQIVDRDINDKLDYVFIASDGVYDTLSTKLIHKVIWQTIQYHKNKSKEVSYEFILSECVNNVLKYALLKQSDDNVTAIMVCFRNLLY